MLPAPVSSATSPSSFTGFVLGHIRCADIKARILVNELTTLGIAVKTGLIDPENAIAHLIEIGASRLLTRWVASNVASPASHQPRRAPLAPSRDIEALVRRRPRRRVWRSTALRHRPNQA
jgi:hypothetical protein